MLSVRFFDLAVELAELDLEDPFLLISDGCCLRPAVCGLLLSLSDLVFDAGALVVVTGADGFVALTLLGDFAFAAGSLDAAPSLVFDDEATSLALPIAIINGYSVQFNKSVKASRLNH